MSVSSVSGGSQRWDAINAMRQARAAAAAQATGSTQADGSSQLSAATSAGSTDTTQPSVVGGAPNLSSDVLASLLQFQSAPVDPSSLPGSDASAPDASTGTTGSSAATGADATQASDGSSGAKRAHHHHHHGGPPPSDDGSASQGDGTSATSSTEAGGAGSSNTAQGGLDDGLQSLFQQLTKATAAYATGGPAGVAASALSQATSVTA